MSATVNFEEVSARWVDSQWKVAKIGSTTVERSVNHEMQVDVRTSKDSRQPLVMKTERVLEGKVQFFSCYDPITSIMHMYLIKINACIDAKHKSDLIELQS